MLMHSQAAKADRFAAQALPRQLAQSLQNVNKGAPVTSPLSRGLRKHVHSRDQGRLALPSGASDLAAWLREGSTTEACASSCRVAHWAPTPAQHSYAASSDALVMSSSTDRHRAANVQDVIRKLHATIVEAATSGAPTSFFSRGILLNRWQTSANPSRPPSSQGKPLSKREPRSAPSRTNGGGLAHSGIG
jgi:hypothetical protein